MKNLKLIFFLVVLILFAVVGYLNSDFLLEKRSIDFYFYTSQEIPIGLLFIAAFLSGTLIALFFNLMTQFKKNIQIKNLTNDGKSHIEKIQQLENEIKNLKTTDLTKGKD
jgi:uncharacterized integral membrane protein